MLTADFWLGALLQTVVVALLVAVWQKLWVLKRYSAFAVLRHPSIIFTRRPVRFSATAMLVCPARRTDGWMLIRSGGGPLEPPYWGPPGGVMKYSSAADEILNGWDVVPAREIGPDEAFGRDLRVFVPGRNLLRFLAWFGRDKGREHFQTTLQRELAEELIVEMPQPDGMDESEWQAFRSELGRALRYSQFDLTPKGSAVDIFRDGGYWNLRLYYICEGHGDAYDDLRRCLERFEGPYVASVSRRAVDGGDFRGERVGAHTQLLYQDRVTRPHVPIRDLPPNA